MNTPRGAWRRMAAALALSSIAALPTAGAANGNSHGLLVDYGFATCSDHGDSGSGGYADECTEPCTEPCCTDQCATCDCGDSCCKPCLPPWAHRSGVWGDALYLHASSADMHHAQQQNGTGGAGTVPFGLVGVADPGYEPGFRVGGSVALSNFTSITAAYTFYESDAVSQVVAPVIPAGGGAVGSLVQHPGAAITASAGPVNAFYDIDFQLAEAEFRALLWGDDRGWVNYSAGGRYAHLEQDFRQLGLFGGSNAGLINTLTGIDFDGGGALFGLDGERRIGRRGFSVYGNAGVAPIFGQFSTVYTELNQTTAVLLANVVWKDDRVVTILDYELGLAWTSCKGHVRLSAGYLAQFWFNTVTTPEFVDAVQASNYTGVGDTLTFDGVVARVELRF